MLYSTPRILKKSINQSKKEGGHKTIGGDLLLHTPREHRKRRGAQKAKTLRNFVIRGQRTVMSYIMDDVSLLNSSVRSHSVTIHLLRQTNKLQDKCESKNIKGRYRRCFRQLVPSTTHAPKLPYFNCHPPKI